MREGVHSVLPDAECVGVPMADGGEGTVDAVVDALHGQHVEVEVSDPLGRTVTARYGYVPLRQLAVIEMAAASGLELVPSGQRDVLHASTFGVGNSSAPRWIAVWTSSSSGSAGRPPTTAAPECSPPWEWCSPTPTGIRSPRRCRVGDTRPYRHVRAGPTPARRPHSCGFRRHRATTRTHGCQRGVRTAKGRHGSRCGDAWSRRSLGWSP